MKIFENSVYSINFSESSEAIQFNWKEAHRNMNFEDFQEACNNFLGFGFEYRAKNILIDVRNFQFQLPLEFPEWQRNEHYPRYYKLGIEKVAYVMPEAYLGKAQEIEKEAGKFELRNFSGLERSFPIFWVEN